MTSRATTAAIQICGNGGALARSCAVAICSLLFVSLLSRMSMSESKLGAYGRGQMQQTVRRVSSEAKAQAEMSQQDKDPLVALMHNLEATAGLKSAKRLSEESGTGSDLVDHDFVGDIADLAEERDSLMHVLALRLQA